MIAMHFLIAIWFLLAAPASAMVVDAPLPQAAQEERAQALFHTLRCAVCSSQSLAESDADIARNMRMLIRSHIQAGESDAAITNFLTARYGEEILMSPPVNSRTLPLWLAPAALLLIFSLIALRLFFPLRRKGS